MRISNTPLKKKRALSKESTPWKQYNPTVDLFVNFSQHTYFKEEDITEQSNIKTQQKQRSDAIGKSPEKVETFMFSMKEKGLKREGTKGEKH